MDIRKLLRKGSSILPSSSRHSSNSSNNSSARNETNDDALVCTKYDHKTSDNPLYGLDSTTIQVTLRRKSVKLEDVMSIPGLGMHIISYLSKHRNHHLCGINIELMPIDVSNVILLSTWFFKEAATQMWVNDKLWLQLRHFCSNLHRYPISIPKGALYRMLQRTRHTVTSVGFLGQPLDLDKFPPYFVPPLCRDIRWDEIWELLSEMKLLHSLTFDAYISGTLAFNLHTPIPQLPQLESLTWVSSSPKSGADLNVLLNSLPNLKSITLVGDFSAFNVANLQGSMLESIRFSRCTGFVTLLQFELLPSLVTLNLNNSQISTLPNEFGEKFPNLSVLLLRNNNITTLPASIGNLKALEIFDVAHNALLELPNAVAMLGNLRVLQLEHNSITSISANTLVFKKLEKFDISDNLLQSAPYIANLTSLQHFTVSNITSLEFVGMGKLAHLQTLTLNHSPQFTRLPDEICELKHLMALKLGHNQLEVLPFGISNMESLRTLDVSHNALVSLPIGLGKLQALIHIDASHNRIRFLPSELSPCRSLKSIHLYHNRLEMLPLEIAQITSLQSLLVHNNSLKGIPHNLVKLVHLQTLHVHNNQLESIPEALFDLPSIEEITFHHNPIKHLPDWAWNWTDMNGTLDWSTFQLLELPSCQEASDAKTLLASTNLLNTLPSSLGRHVNLVHIKLENNCLTSLPRTIGDLRNLKTLELAGNALMTIPAECKQLYRLKHLDVSRNKLTNFPNEIGFLASLRYLNAACNHLHHLPMSLFSLATLETLLLSRNTITELPTKVGNLANLKHFCIDSNGLTHLPESIGELGRLELLDVRHNKLTELPDSVGRLHELQNLVLNGNNLTKLPTTLTSLTSIVFISVDNPQLASNFPFHIKQRIGGSYF